MFLTIVGKKSSFLHSLKVNVCALFAGRLLQYQSDTMWKGTSKPVTETLMSAIHLVAHYGQEKLLN